MSREKLDEYVLQFQSYQDGNYEYGTIATPQDLENAIANRKKLVFLKSKYDSKTMIITGGIFLILGLIIGIVISLAFNEYWIIIFSICMGISGATSLFFLIPGFSQVGTSFLILGQEGIVYKLPRGAIQGFEWDGIYMDIIGVQSTTRFFGVMKIENPRSIEINISMPNDDVIKVSFGTYTSREFTEPRTFVAARNFQALFVLTFKLFFDYGKGDTVVKQRLKENENKITKNLMISKGIDKENYLAELKEDYQKYKHKIYQFGKYGTTDQIRNEFLEGKTFILKGGLRRGDWGFILFFCAMGLFIFTMMTLISFELIGFGIIFIFFWGFFASLFLVKLRKLIVVGSSGVYYQKTISQGFFFWDDITHIEGKTTTFRGITSTIVTLFFNNGEKRNFASRPYLVKEFPKKVEHEMFLNLFKVYFKLGRNPNL